MSTLVESHLVDRPKLKGRSGNAGEENPNPVKYQTAGLAAVALGMGILFLRPTTTYFLLGVFVATPVMMFVTFWLTHYSNLFNPSIRSLGIGILSSGALYAIFYAGNELIKIYRPLGMTSSAETSIYSTIGSHPLYLQVIILVLDAFGFESYFRGNLQKFFSNRIGNGDSRIAGVFLSALCDSMIHIISLNPVWVVTTFVADSIWGLTYHYTKDLGSSVTSHLVWDIFIFIVAPIR